MTNGTDAKITHLNIPTNPTFQAALDAYMEDLSYPIGSATGPLGRPSVAYAVMALVADSIGYTIQDADRTSGRQSLTDEERKLSTALKDKTTRAALMAMLRDAGITL
jgi:hypothetical protein